MPRMIILVHMENSKTPKELLEEANFRKELKELRTQKGWTQGDLAKAMRDEGWTDYNQTTVSRLEKGQRPLTLAESRTLARLFNTYVGNMIAPSVELRQMGRFYDALEKYQERNQEFRDIVSSLDNAYVELKKALEIITVQERSDFIKAIPEGQENILQGRVDAAFNLLATNTTEKLAAYYKELEDDFIHWKQSVGYDEEEAHLSSQLGNLENE